jgi:hypothetical protein
MLSLVIPEILPPFILVIFDPFSYTWAENESENLSALRKTAKPAASRRRRRLLLPRAPHPAQAPPRNGRLEEANKVTSLMRRRENPRHISAARLMCNSAQERRGFFEPKQAAPRTDTSGFTPVLRGPAACRVSGVGDRYVAPRAARLSGPGSSRRAYASQIHINGRGTLPSIPPAVRGMLVQIPRRDRSSAARRRAKCGAPRFWNAAPA